MSAKMLTFSTSTLTMLHIFFGLAFGNAVEGEIASQLANKTIKFRQGGRPVTRYEETVEIDATFSLLEAPAINVDQESVSVRASLEMAWFDPYLVWTKKGDQVQTISVDSAKSDIWRPEIIHRENVESVNFVTEIGEQAPLRVYSNGTVKWKTMGVFLSRCQLTLYAYPFDINVCGMRLQINYPDMVKFGSVTVAKSDDYEADSDVKPFYLIDFNWVWNAETKGDGTDMSVFNITLKIGRRSAYHVLNVLAPCALIAICQFTTFLLPLRHPVRAIHSMTLLVALGFFQSVIKDAIPKTNQDVLLMIYVLVQMAFGTAYTLHSTLMAYLATPALPDGGNIKETHRQGQPLRGLTHSEPLITARAYLEFYRRRSHARLNKLNKIDTLLFVLAIAGNAACHGVFYYNITNNSY